MRLRLLPLISLLALALVGSAQARDTSRADYIAKVDPICKRTDHRLRQVFEDFPEALEQDDGDDAAHILRKASRIYVRSLRQVGAVEPPADDANLIGRWLSLEHADVRVTRKMANAQDANDVDRYNALVEQSRTLEHRINATIGDYGFRQCN